MLIIAVAAMASAEPSFLIGESDMVQKTSF
jgi:hypothetical protein